jgi:aspartate-semialdehyde dehydrogenase
MSKKPQIAVVGATGVIGQELLAAIASAGHPADAVTALASERSAGRELEFADETIEVEPATEESFRGVGLAYFATPAEVSKTLARAAQAAGAWAVDLSSAFRLEESVPLILPAVNLAQLRAPVRGRIVSCPSAITTALVTALDPLRPLGLDRVFATAMLGVSSAGSLGLDALQRQTADMLSGREPEVVRFPHRIGFNLIPQVGDFNRSAEWSSEELSWGEEAARIWSGTQSPPILGTAFQAPTFYGHLLNVEVQLASAPGVAGVREAMKSSAHLKLLDAPIERVYPMPMLASGDPTVHVGRIRELRGWGGGFTFVVAVDNARRGGALNAIEIGEALLAQEEAA